MKQDNFYLKVEKELKKKEDIVSALKKMLESLESLQDSKNTSKDKVIKKIRKSLE